MMKVLVIITLFIAAIFAAPAIDEDVRSLENHNDGDYNGVEEHISAKFHTESYVSTTSPTMEKIQQINKICMEETKTDKKLLDMVMIYQIIPTDPKYKNFLACSYKKQKYMNDRGEIQFENIRKFLTKYYKEEDLKILDVCGKLEQTDNGGDNAYNALKCILPKLYLLHEIFDE